MAFIGLLLPFLAQEKVEALWGSFVVGSLFHHLYLLEQLLGLSVFVFFNNVSYNFHEIVTYYQNMDYDHWHSALGIVEKKHTR